MQKARRVPVSTIMVILIPWAPPNPSKKRTRPAIKRNKEAFIKTGSISIMGETFQIVSPMYRNCRVQAMVLGVPTVSAR